MKIKDLWEERDALWNYVIHPLIHFKLFYGQRYVKSLLDVAKFCEDNPELDCDEMIDDIYQKVTYEWLTYKCEEWL